MDCRQFWLLKLDIVVTELIGLADKLTTGLDGVDTNVKQEVQDLSEGLRETVKAVADEMQIKPQILNKAINVAFKSNMADVQEQMDELESILVSTGHLKEDD